MSCCCSDKKTKTPQSPDCMASRSTTVTTPEGEDVQVNFNMGTGEVTYGSTACCTGVDDKKTATTGCCCAKKEPLPTEE